MENSRTYSVNGFFYGIYRKYSSSYLSALLLACFKSTPKLHGKGTIKYYQIQIKKEKIGSIKAKAENKQIV